MTLLHMIMVVIAYMQVHAITANSQMFSGYELQDYGCKTFSQVVLVKLRVEVWKLRVQIII